MGSSQLVDRTLSHPFISSTLNFLSAHTDDPVVRWARKHSDAPFAAGKKWIVEHFQFGSCMFDVPGLKERYARLVRWDGLWVNYWTETLPRRKTDGAVVVETGSEKETYEERDRNNDAALLENGMTEPSTPTPKPLPLSDATSDAPSETPDTPTIELDKAAQKAERKAAEKAEKTRLKEEKNAEKALKKHREAEMKAKAIIPPRHFIVLPTGIGRVLGGSDKWESVIIGGVQDEVAAHCGLFIRGQNLDYDGLVERVGQRVLAWCEVIR